ncbi:MAG: hypothetical protein ACUVRV_09330 [Cyanobacteriota bacterium]
MTSLTGCGDPCPETDPISVGIVAVRPAAEPLIRQKLPYFLPYFAGISQATVGAKGISINWVVILPGDTAQNSIFTPTTKRLFICSKAELKLAMALDCGR